MLRYVRSFSIKLPRMTHREIFVMQDVNPLSELAGDASGVVKGLSEMPVFASEVVIFMVKGKDIRHKVACVSSHVLITWSCLCPHLTLPT
jgi:hypothetical protein